MDSDKKNHLKDTKQQQHKENKIQPSRESPDDNDETELPETAAESKWPLTRLERIQELDIMYKEMEGTPQVENIKAAKAWYSQFPLNEYVQDETVFFQKGRKIEESEMKASFIWSEVS